ncbi:nitroreductase family protein [Oceaniovalibus guishaninsula JLT2003]|uniref:Putative NAD(P)H nitroreductase n=1 Tax=Oceaniovalibus guishaninsula JLT2003 TaxID=1231392 RepID=K2GP57_9RHOB|nr:nitroreductase family protein [Oceaniovalibus guishaninsula]EKE44481.1 nitroreductase family protein [Oceaniovalibus guishaninsula JLT2003]
MPTPNPAALDFLLTRRSRPAKTLGLPVPDRAALEPILQAALRSPDHGKLEPWRLIVLERAALLRLGRLAADRGAALGKSEPEIAKQRSQYDDSHLAVAVIAVPQDSGKIPVVEQTLSAGAVCLGLLNAALAAGWGANWLTGWASQDADFAREGLHLDANEWVAGLIHLGTERVTPPERPRPDMAAKVSWLSA